MGTGRVRGCWRETRRRETVSGQLLGSCPAGANSGMSHGRMLPVRRQLLLYKPWAAHRPLLHLHLSSPPRAEKPPAVLGGIAAPSGSSPALRIGAHPASPLPKPAGGMRRPGKSQTPYLSGARSPRTLGNGVLLGGGQGLETIRKEQNC